MLIDFKEIIAKYHINIKGIIQVGAHWAEEHDVYVDLGVNKIVYIEPCKEAFEKMLTKFGGISNTDFDIEAAFIGEYIKMFKVACGEHEDTLPMFVSHNNQGQSNSLLKPLLHLQQHPEVVFNDSETVRVVPLDKLPFEHEDYNILILDCQGFEGQILKGATKTLASVDLIYTECNNGQTYEGNMELDEMDDYLKAFGFVRTDTYFPSPNWTWGDCAYVKNSILHS